MIYMDNAATTPTASVVVDEMLKYFTIIYGNPSSKYEFSNRSKIAINNSRKIIAETINASPDEIYFTSGGTESDNWALNAILSLNPLKNHIITSVIEHPAILRTAENLMKKGVNVTFINVDENGIIKIKELKKAITDKTALISIMYANNEIGTIQPIEEISNIALENGIPFHTDAVQAYTQLPIDVKALNIGLMSASAHKFYGPKGIGFLYCDKNINISPLIFGGGQEKGLRSGTENVPAIVGMATASKICSHNMLNSTNYVKRLRDYFIKRILTEIPFSRINGDKLNRLPGNINVSFQFVNSKELLAILDINNICASAGSACSSSKKSSSHVLLAIGLDEELANSSIRFSISKNNTKEEIDYCMNILKRAIYDLRNSSMEYSYLKNF